MKFKKFEYTVVGPRSENQDSLRTKAIDSFCVACIADGVGGKDCGSLASKLATDFFMLKVTSSNVMLNEVILDAHEEILSTQINNSNCKGMATTFTGCSISDWKLKGVQVGDSRLCVLRKNGIKQLTESHTEANRLLKSGKLSIDDYHDYPRKNIIESALGINTSLTIQTFEFQLEIGDRILLTTDGVHEKISKKEFRDLSLKSSTTEAYGNNIVELLNSKKLSDNASFILISIE